MVEVEGLVDQVLEDDLVLGALFGLGPSLAHRCSFSLPFLLTQLFRLDPSLAHRLTLTLVSEG